MKELNQAGINTSQRRPYQKPELMRVSLRPEEAVLANCKTSNLTNGPAGSPPLGCTNGGSGSCLAIAS